LWAFFYCSAISLQSKALYLRYKLLKINFTMENNEVSHTGAWVGAVLAVLYLISPIDFVPDVVPIAGWLDDATF